MESYNTIGKPGFLVDPLVKTTTLYENTRGKRGWQIKPMIWFMWGLEIKT